MKEARNHGLSWHRSGACADSNCVEVAGHKANVYLRGGETEDGVLRFTRAEWDAFLTGAKAGDFDSV